MSMQNEALIDELTKQYNSGEGKTDGIPKRRGANKRKGLSEVKANEVKPSGDIPSMVETGTRAWNIAQRIVDGKPLVEIAAEYGLEQSAIKAVITTAMEEVFEQTAPVFANFAMISMNRMERIVEGLLPLMFNDQGAVNPDAIELYRKIYSDQKELVLMMTGAGKGKQAIPDINNTLTSGSKLYNESMDALRSRKYGEEPEREAPIKDLDELFKNDGIIVGSARQS